MLTLAVMAPYALVLLIFGYSVFPIGRMEIRTGTKGGVYKELGKSLEARLKSSDGWLHDYEAVDSHGDHEDLIAIEKGNAHLAFATDGLFVAGSSIRTILPVSTAYLHVIVQKDSEINSRT